MKKLISALIFSFLFALSFSQPGRCCSCFFLSDRHNSIFGHNFDWFYEDGLIIVNKKGVLKTAYLFPRAESSKGVTWTSKYGSITFNLFGREFPFGGMNEAGLVVYMKGLKEMRYPDPDSRKAITQNQWIQYQLDSCTRIEEVIENARKIRILNIYPTDIDRGHQYMVCDKNGNCAVIAFHEGKMVCYTDETLPVRALVSKTYEESIEYLRKHIGFGGKFSISRHYAPLDRFVRVADFLKNFDPESSGPIIEYAFGILKDVSYAAGRWYTMWSIVFDMNNFQIYWINLNNKNIRTLNLKSFDFSCKSPVQVLKIKSALSGDVSDKFIDYTTALNQDIIKNVPVAFTADIDDLATYPETTVCRE